MRPRNSVSIAFATMTILLCACASTAPTAPKSTWRTGAPWKRIAELEDARSTNDGELVRLLESDDAELRARVATALGRMPFPDEGAEVTRALLGALFDADANVRAAAAFGLGMRGDASAADKLLFVALDYHEADHDGVVRARALEAATKLERPELRERMLDGLLDADARVRVEAAEGASRWPTSDANASVVNQRLVDSLANEKDRDVIVYTLFALERRKAKEAADVFANFARVVDADERIFAIRGLKALAPDERVRPLLLVSALGGYPSDVASDDANIVQNGAPTGWAPDWRGECEAALGLGAYHDPVTLRFLQRVARADNAHVRRCGWDALGNSLPALTDLDVLEAMLAATAPDKTPGGSLPILPDDASPSVRASMAEALVPALARRAKAAAPDDTTAVRSVLITLLNQGSPRTSPIVGAGIARGLGKVDDPAASDLLRVLTAEHDFTVREAAIEALGKHPTPQVRELLHSLLADNDNGVRLSAVTALGEMPDASDLDPLQRCFDSSSGDGAPEIRFNVLRNAAKVGGDPALKMLVAALADPNRFVRKVAHEELERAFTDMKVTQLDLDVAAPKPAQVPEPGVDFPLYAANPRVEVVTNRGVMVFELFPREAPSHVHNFLTLAARGYYAGLDFHRVVPDFVIQGGDYRGDGNGGGTWRGRDDALRHEIGPRKFVRGSLGMPRNEDVDSGGSQFFVAHRPTPHLDGRYTIFGELREGFDVLDEIEVGDKIVSVRVLHDAAKP